MPQSPGNPSARSVLVQHPRCVEAVEPTALARRVGQEHSAARTRVPAACTLEILRVMELDVDVDVVRKAAGEQLLLLVRREAAGVRHTRLERIQVRINSKT